MASDSVSVSGPVEVESGSRHSIAFKLMQHIAGYDKVPSDQRDRRYWLTLYHQCHKATGGQRLELVLKDD